MAHDCTSGRERGCGDGLDGRAGAEGRHAGHHAYPKPRLRPLSGEETRMVVQGHRLTLMVCAAFVVGVAFLVCAFAAWTTSAGFTPQFDMVVTVEGPMRLGCFEVYTNARYESPAQECLTH